MKKRILLFAVFIVFLIDFLHAPKDNAIATIQMDGLGFYRVNQYKIDKDNCVLFFDKVDTYIRFCGAYKIRHVYEYYIQRK